jgi:hypothetical protein
LGAEVTAPNLLIDIVCGPDGIQVSNKHTPHPSIHMAASSSYRPAPRRRSQLRPSINKVSRGSHGYVTAPPMSAQTAACKQKILQRHKAAMHRAATCRRRLRSAGARIMSGGAMPAR